MDQANFFITRMANNGNVSKFERNSNDIKSIVQYWNTAPAAPLHKYQIEALMSTWEQADFDRANVPPGHAQPMVLVAPTGSGKTSMIVFLPYVLAARKTLILTPSELITDQIRAAFVGTPCFFDKINMVPASGRDKFIENVIEEPKVIKGPSDADTLCNLVIVNAQKFGGDLGLSLIHQDKPIVGDARNFFERFDTLIVDEAHHYTAGTWQKLVEEFQRPVGGLNKRILFLSATAYKYEGDEINKTRKLILNPGQEHRIVYNIPRELLTGVTIRKCMFHEPAHNGTPDMIFQDLEQIFRNQMKIESRFVPQAMILAGLNEDAFNLARDLNLDFEERYLKLQPDPNLENFAVAVVEPNKDALRKFSEGKFRVLVTCGKGLEGYENPNVVACVVLRKIVTGRMLFEQFVGRCLRVNKQVAGMELDKTVGVVLSYPEYELRFLWQELFEEPVIAEKDEDDET